MLRSTPPVIATSNSCSARPSIAAFVAAIADAQAASIVKFGPWRSKRLATRPARQLLSSPGIVSSLIGGSHASRCPCSSEAIAVRTSVGSAVKLVAPPELAGELGEDDAQRGQVVLLAAHRVADDDRGALEVQRALGPAAVGQGHARAGDGPLLRAVHGVADLGRHRQPPAERIPLPVAHPSADLRVRLLVDERVGIVEERRIPTARVDLRDGVVALADVAPEGPGVRRVGQDRSDADERDGAVGRAAMNARRRHRRSRPGRPRGRPGPPGWRAARGARRAPRPGRGRPRRRPSARRPWRRSGPRRARWRG